MKRIKQHGPTIDDVKHSIEFASGETQGAGGRAGWAMHGLRAAREPSLVRSLPRC